MVLEFRLPGWPGVRGRGIRMGFLSLFFSPPPKPFPLKREEIKRSFLIAASPETHCGGGVKNGYLRVRFYLAGPVLPSEAKQLVF
jgi:hypothetical protein